MTGAASPERAGAALAFALVLGCTYQPIDGDAERPSPQLEQDGALVISPAPEHLRGRVALPAGARLYARPDYSSSSWELRLPEPPLMTADAPPRARAFRVIGVVSDPYAGDFVAVTNALADPDAEASTDARGCGPALADLPHLRLLLFVPILYLAEVTTRSLELELHSPAGERELVRVGAGVRVGPSSALGMPPPAAGSSWRWIDADGIRVVAPVPDEALGRAWDAREHPAERDAGERLLRDADGSIMWLRDEGGASVELTLRNACGEYLREVEDPAEVESLRALALDVFYDQAPPAERLPAPPPSADYRIAANTALRWPDGELAGEVLRVWPVEVGVGRTWNDRRCFTLELGSELVPVDQPGLACVNPDALEVLDAASGFAISNQVELGGSIELGPAEPLSGSWEDVALRELLNARHESSAECLRSLLVDGEGLERARWLLDLLVEDGRVEAVTLTALGPTADAVEDCLEAEAYTWGFPGGEGQLRVPVTLGSWAEAPADPEPELDATPKPDEAEAEPERGKVIIIRDDDEDPE